MEENCHLPAMCPQKKDNKKGNNGAGKTERGKPYKEALYVCTRR